MRRPWAVVRSRYKWLSPTSFFPLNLFPVDRPSSCLKNAPQFPGRGVTVVNEWLMSEVCVGGGSLRIPLEFIFGIWRHWSDDDIIIPIIVPWFDLLSIRIKLSLATGWPRKLVWCITPLLRSRRRLIWRVSFRPTVKESAVDCNLNSFFFDLWPILQSEMFKFDRLKYSHEIAALVKRMFCFIVWDCL